MKETLVEKLVKHYEGIFPWGSFKDSNVEQMCKEAFAQNPSRNNGNHW